MNSRRSFTLNVPVAGELVLYILHHLSHQVHDGWDDCATPQGKWEGQRGRHLASHGPSDGLSLSLYGEGIFLEEGAKASLELLTPEH